MKSQQEIEQRYTELNERMQKSIDNMDMFENISIDAQRFILEWVLDRE